MSVAWDELYDPLQSAYLGPEEAFDKEGHHYHHHHHHHDFQPYMNGDENSAEHDTNTYIAATLQWTPPANICETRLAYHIDVEVPGAVDMTNFQVHWLTSHTMMIDASALPRRSVHLGPDQKGSAIREEKTEAEHPLASPTSKSKSDNGGGVLHRCAGTAKEGTTRIVLDERKLGPWRRSFTLPIGVDVKTAKAFVEFGLLHISVLKKTQEANGVIEL